MTQTRVPPPPLCRGPLTNKYFFSSKSNIDMVCCSLQLPTHDLHLHWLILPWPVCPSSLNQSAPAFRSHVLCTKNCSTTCLLAEHRLIQLKNTQTDWVRFFFLSYFVLVLQRCIEMSVRSAVAWCWPDGGSGQLLDTWYTRCRSHSYEPH